MDPYEVGFEAWNGVEHTTDMSLIYRVQNRQRQGWAVLAEIYMPMVYRWSRLRKLQPTDAGDVVQSVFEKLLRNIDMFTKQHPGDTFRGWLRRITEREIINERRRRAATPQAAHEVDDFAGAAHASVDESHTPLLDALDSIRSRVTPQTWDVFVRTVLYNESPCEVAADLGVAQNAVRQARYRVARLLRLELAALARSELREDNAGTRTTPAKLSTPHAESA
jgi:RNA polymerase sigma-70 factor (ECF subfamily)